MFGGTPRVDVKRPTASLCVLFFFYFFFFFFFLPLDVHRSLVLFCFSSHRRWSHFSPVMSMNALPVASCDRLVSWSWSWLGVIRGRGGDVPHVAALGGAEGRGGSRPYLRDSALRPCPLLPVRRD